MSPVYELRIYSLHPKDTGRYIELSKQWMHLRTAASKMVGFWFSELGGLNEAVHIWEYDSLSARAEVRKKLGGNESWQKNFITPAAPLWIQQNNSVLKLKDGTVLKTDNIQPGGVYELQSVPCGTTPGPILEGTTLIGDFQTVFGPVSKGFRLLHHSSIDKAPEASQASLSGVEGKVYSRLMNAAAWSALQ